MWKKNLLLSNAKKFHFIEATAVLNPDEHQSIFNWVRAVQSANTACIVTTKVSNFLLTPKIHAYVYRLALNWNHMYLQWNKKKHKEDEKTKIRRRGENQTKPPLKSDWTKCKTYCSFDWICVQQRNRNINRRLRAIQFVYLLIGRLLKNQFEKWLWVKLQWYVPWKYFTFKLILKIYYKWITN